MSARETTAPSDPKHRRFLSSREAPGTGGALSRRDRPVDLAGECDGQFDGNYVDAALEAIQCLAVEAEFPVLWPAEGPQES
jgi:hypothetical protein